MIRWLTATVLILTGLCTCTPSQKNTPVDSTDVQLKSGTGSSPVVTSNLSFESARHDCDSVLLRVLRSSNFKPLKNFKGLSFQIEDASAEIIQIRAYTISDVDKRVTLGWITIDLGQQLLSDITNDPDHPVELAYDALAFSNFKTCWVSKRKDESSMPYGD